MKTKYNKRRIMHDAWADFKQKKILIGFEGITFGDCLREAWAEAKKKAAKEAALEAAINDAIIPTSVGTMYMKKGVVDDTTMGWYVYGKTYYNKENIKQAGFRWSPETKCWFTTNIEDAKDLLEFFA